MFEPLIFGWGWSRYGFSGVRGYKVRVRATGFEFASVF